MRPNSTLSQRSLHRSVSGHSTTAGPAHLAKTRFVCRVRRRAEIRHSVLRPVSLCQQIGLPFRKTLPWRFPIIRHFLTLVCQFHDSGSSVSRLRARAEPSCPLAGPGAARPPRAGRVSRDPGRPSPLPVLRPALPKLLESTDSDSESGASEPAELRRGRRQGQSSVPASAEEQPRSRAFGVFLQVP
jgi:hypothetical protein